MDDKQRFGRAKAAFARTMSKFSNALKWLKDDPPSTERPVRYVYMHPFKGPKTPYRRPELRRHELRRLNKQGLKLSGDNTRQFEYLLS